MSTIPGTNVAAMVVPFDTADIFATHNDKYGRGGFRVCDTLADRDAITDLRRKAGMWVRCIEDGKVYEMALDLITWNEVTFGGGGTPAPQNLFIAGENLSGHRMVLVNTSHEAIYASNDNLAHADSVFGLTTNAALTGNAVEVVREKEVQEPSWSWVVGGAIYLGANGALIQSAPVSPALFLLCVGFATATDRMFVSVGTPIILA